MFSRITHTLALSLIIYIFYVQSVLAIMSTDGGVFFAATYVCIGIRYIFIRYTNIFSIYEPVPSETKLGGGFHFIRKENLYDDFEIS